MAGDSNEIGRQDDQRINGEALAKAGPVVRNIQRVLRGF
jgi:hypothetical protein